MRVRSKVALSFLVVLGLLILVATVWLAVLWFSLDDPIDGWLDEPTTPTTTSTP